MPKVYVKHSKTTKTPVFVSPERMFVETHSDFCMSVRPSIISFGIDLFQIAPVWSGSASIKQSWIIVSLWEQTWITWQGQRSFEVIIRSSVRPSVKGLTLLQSYVTRFAMYVQTLDHRCTMGTFTLWRTWIHMKCQRSFANCYSYFILKLFKLLLFSALQCTTKLGTYVALWDSHYDSVLRGLWQGQRFGGHWDRFQLPFSNCSCSKQVRFNYNQTW